MNDVPWRRGEVHPTGGYDDVHAEPPKLFQGSWLRKIVFTRRGERYRTDGPAEIHVRNATGTPVVDVWFTDRHIGRTDGPAEIAYFPTGEIERVRWYLRSRPHRIGGPAVFEYDRDGRTTASAQFSYRGKSAYSVAGYADLLREKSPTMVEEDLRLAGFVDLLDAGASVTDVIEIFAAGVLTHDGVREVLAGAPPEWVRSFEESSPDPGMPGLSRFASALPFRA